MCLCDCKCVLYSPEKTGSQRISAFAEKKHDLSNLCDRTEQQSKQETSLLLNGDDDVCDCSFLIGNMVPPEF